MREAQREDGRVPATVSTPASDPLRRAPRHAGRRAKRPSRRVAILSSTAVDESASAALPPRARALSRFSQTEVSTALPTMGFCLPHSGNATGRIGQLVYGSVGGFLFHDSWRTHLCTAAARSSRSIGFRLP